MIDNLISLLRIVIIEESHPGLNFVGAIGIECGPRAFYENVTVIFSFFDEYAGVLQVARVASPADPNPLLIDKLSSTMNAGFIVFHNVPPPNSFPAFSCLARKG